jgi:hypothetical protein
MLDKKVALESIYNICLGSIKSNIPARPKNRVRSANTEKKSPYNQQIQPYLSKEQKRNINY